MRLPIGTQDAGLLDARIYDEDADAISVTVDMFDDDNDDDRAVAETTALRYRERLKRRVTEVYAEYTT